MSGCPRKRWINGIVLPFLLKEGVDEEVVDKEYLGELYSCALLYNDIVTVFTRTRYLTLEDEAEDKAEDKAEEGDSNDIDKKKWIPHSYGSDPRRSRLPSIKYLTPTLHDGGIAAVIQREEPIPIITVEILTADHEERYWKLREPAPLKCCIGTGRFLSVKLDDQTD